eukprot:1177531-Prorocentrum_minimum.AAC.4
MVVTCIRANCSAKEKWLGSSGQAWMEGGHAKGASARRDPLYSGACPVQEKGLRVVSAPTSSSGGVVRLDGQRHERAQQRGYNLEDHNKEAGEGPAVLQQEKQQVTKGEVEVAASGTSL